MEAPRQAFWTRRIGVQGVDGGIGYWEPKRGGTYPPEPKRADHPPSPPGGQGLLADPEIGDLAGFGSVLTVLEPENGRFTMSAPSAHKIRVILATEISPIHNYLTRPLLFGVLKQEGG